jgi:hypothetical protein
MRAFVVIRLTSHRKACGWLQRAGLDNAGKSTLLHKLCNNELRAFVPTTKAHAKTFSLGSITFTAWDLGGHEQVWQERGIACIDLSCSACILTSLSPAPSTIRYGICGRNTTLAQTPSFSSSTAPIQKDSTRCVCRKLPCSLFLERGVLVCMQSSKDPLRCLRLRHCHLKGSHIGLGFSISCVSPKPETRNPKLQIARVYPTPRVLPHPSL